MLERHFSYRWESSQREAGRREAGQQRIGILGLQNCLAGVGSLESWESPHCAASSLMQVHFSYVPIEYLAGTSVRVNL